MRDEHEDLATGSAAGVWPAWARYPVIVVLVAFALTGLVVLVYDRGWLPLAGPFVAVIFASTLVYLIMYARHRRLARATTDAIGQLRELVPALARERSAPRDARPTGASDDSLDRAAEQVELALQRFSWGHEQGAVPHLAELSSMATATWRPEADLSRRIARLAATGARLDETIRRMLAAAERRRR